MGGRLYLHLDRQGWLYVATVVDLFSRRVVGWSMSASMTAQLATDAQVMAIWRRGKPKAVLHHSAKAANTPASRSNGC
jgi:putative transposase